MTAGVYAELSADNSMIVLAVTGDSFELDRAASALRRLTMQAKPTVPKGMLTVPACWAAVTQLAYTFSSDSVGRWLPQHRLRGWIEAEFLRRCSPGDAHAWFRPASGLVPRPYQVEGALMIGCAGKALIFDDPGCGKTATTILGLVERAARGYGIFPVLIVVPSWDVADVWVRETRAWTQGWPDPVLYGGPGRAANGGDDLLITTYATLRLDAADMAGPLVKLRPETVIADEVHLAKNENSQQSLALRRVASRAGTFVGLTGTPITRDTGDIFPVLQAMEPAAYPARGRFVKRYLDTVDDGYGEQVEGLKVLAEPEFRTALAGQYRRVSKKDVLPQLPPKVYSVRRVEIPDGWRKAYDTMAEDMLAELPDGGELPVMSVLAQLTRLGQLASAACDVVVTEDIDLATGELVKHYEVTLKQPCWKADALLGVLAERKGQQAAVFANSKQLVLLAAGACQQAGYSYGLITGGQSQKSRQAGIDAFQAGQLDVILATAGAGSLGITLTAAGSVVMLQRSYELDKAIQPEDRAHRIGQQHDMVEVIDIVAKDTVDDRARELMRLKGSRLGQLVRDPRIVRELLGGLK